MVAGYRIAAGAGAEAEAENSQCSCLPVKIDPAGGTEVYESPARCNFCLRSSVPSELSDFPEVEDSEALSADAPEDRLSFAMTIG